MITKTSRLKQKCILYLVSRNASQNRIGRLMLREDGSGAIASITTVRWVRS